MKRIIKSRIFAFILGAIIFGSVGVIAANYAANEISFTTNKNGNVKTVKDALDDLYIKTNKQPTQVATLTTQGASYTMQNDGYIVGTAGNGTNRDAAILYLDESQLVLAQWDDDNIVRNVSVYATKDTVVTTRTNHATYNLTVYEWK